MITNVSSYDSSERQSCKASVALSDTSYIILTGHVYNKSQPFHLPLHYIVHTIGNTKAYHSHNVIKLVLFILWSICFRFISWQQRPVADSTKATPDSHFPFQKRTLWHFQGHELGMVSSCSQPKQRGLSKLFSLPKVLYFTF